MKGPRDVNHDVSWAVDHDASTNQGSEGQGRGRRRQEPRRTNGARDVSADASRAPGMFFLFYLLLYSHFFTYRHILYPHLGTYSGFFEPSRRQRNLLVRCPTSLKFIMPPSLDSFLPSNQQILYLAKLVSKR
jgi:hypothetical protein